jgi:hypothetical protein
MSAGLLVGGRAAQRLRLAEARDQRLGAADDQEMPVPARRTGGLDLALELLAAQQLLASVGSEAGHLGESLVLDHDRGGAGPLVLRHGVDDVHRIAETGVDIGDDRQR